MSILYDEGQEAIATESRRVLEARLSKEDMLSLLEGVGRYHEGFWRTAKEQGWTALALPEAYGGLDLGLVELGLIAHQAGRTLSGAPFLTASFGVAKAIALYGSDDQKAAWLPGLARGDTIGAVAFAEGANALPAAPSLTLAAGRLEGRVSGVAGGLAAEVALVFAQGPEGPVLAIADLAEAERSAIASFDNSRLYADLAFAGTRAELLLAGEAAREAALHILAL
ncbi:acyl-CoA dehydrogenase family protein [Sphingopyxis sp. 113P3]|uniref:acyl-CoA dehydrogenase family protein n=1 Tax=Sphingopyxis sp. (strain 113P3) TaxID=292913 RepID=UPI000AA05B85|nr:acyl-CoA dehydrogenase family protein [Sphingopyxis sp. 113P3]